MTSTKRLYLAPDAPSVYENDHYLVMDKVGSESAVKILASDFLHEVVSARNSYPDLDARLDALVLAGGNVAARANGTSAAGQKVLTVTTTTGFIVGAFVVYPLNGSATLQGNIIASINAGVSLVLTNDIGATPAGGVLDGTYVSMISISEYLAAQAIPHAGTLLLPQTMEYANGGVYNAAAYGMSPGATAAVNVAAIQAAIDAADAPGATVLIPAGVYSIDSTISMINRSGVRLSGQGSSSQYAAGTKLIWTGSAGDIMLDMSGTNYCTVEGIGFYANASDPGVVETNLKAIFCAGNTEFNGSFFNHVEHCWFQNFDLAVELGKIVGLPGDQVDSWTFEKCWWYHGPTGTCVKINSYNSLNITLSHCTMVGAAALSGGETSKVIHLVDGNVKLIGCITAANKYVVYSEDISGNLGIFMHHSEEDGTLLYTTAYGNHQKANAVVITDLFSYAPVDQVFYFGNANWQYVVNGAFITGAGLIYVPDDPQEVFLNQVTASGGLTVKNISDAAVDVYGWYGTQGTSVRTGRLPAIADLVIGSGGTAITKHLSDSAAWNPGELTNGSSEAADFTVVGAAVGDVVTVGMRLTVGGTDETGAWQISGRVRTTNIVTVTLTNHTGETKNLESQTCRVDVWKH